MLGVDLDQPRKVVTIPETAVSYSLHGNTVYLLRQGVGETTVEPRVVETGATRKLGPGDGTGNQGIKPQDGTGNGSPRQTWASNGKTRAKKQGKAAKSGNGNSGSSGSGRGTLSRSRARNLSGSGNGNCTGSGAGSRRGSRGSRGSGGGRR